MRHNYLKNDPDSCSHWAVKNSNNDTIFVQLGNDAGELIKLELSTEQAEAMATQLFNSIHSSTTNTPVMTHKHAEFLSDNQEETQNEFTKAWQERLADPENSVFFADEPLTPQEVHERLNKLMNDLATESTDNNS